MNHPTAAHLDASNRSYAMKKFGSPSSVRSTPDSTELGSIGNSVEFDTESASASAGEDGSLGYRDRVRQLDFSRVGLVGRDVELAMLYNVVDRLFLRDGDANNNNSDNNSDAYDEQQHERTLTFISGVSGSGKSALALHLQSYCLQQKDTHAFFASGKFDLHQMEEPYSGIKQAMMQLCHQIIALPSNQLADIRRLLKLGLMDAELQTLLSVIPILPGLLREHSSGPDQGKDSDDEEAEDISETGVSDSSPHHQVHQRQQPTRPSQQGHVGYREMSDRLVFALRKFLQIVCDYCPLILVMDDIQWADKASLDLLQSWVLDNKIQSLMIVGCCRLKSSNDDSSSNHDGNTNNSSSDNSTLSDSGSTNLQTMMQALETSKRERSVRILSITIQDLTLNDIRGMLSQLLSPSDMNGNLEALAVLVHQKTNGSPLFVKQFLESLVQKKILAHSSNGWMYDEATMKQLDLLGISTNANILEHIQEKLQNLQAAKNILPIAACLGTIFSTSRLVIVIRAMSIHSDHAAFFSTLSNDTTRTTYFSEEDIRRMLKICEREGLLMEIRPPLQPSGGRRRNEKYNFVHDKVREAAISLVPPDKQSELQFRVGEILLSGFSSEALTKNVFIVANLVNSRLDLVPNDSRDGGGRRMKITLFNYKAGKQAVSCSAFYLALTYFENAIRLLPDDHWESHFQTSLDIYSSAAECAYVTSNIDQMCTYCGRIIDREDCTILDKIRAYHILIDVSIEEAQQHNTTDTVEMCLSVLRQLGCNFPKTALGRSFATLRGLMNMKRTSSRWTPQTFENLSICFDPTESAIMKTLDKLATAAYLTKPDLLPLAVLKSVRRTIDNGITPHASPAFAFQGMIMGYFVGRIDLGRKIGDISLQMLKMLDDKSSESRTLFLVNFTTLHWTSPVEAGLSSFLESYRIGMATGDVESAAWGIQTYLTVSFFVGRPLQQLDAEFSMYSKIVKDFRQANQEQFLLMNWQVVQNLRGLSDHRTLLVGDAFDERIFLNRPTSEIDQPIYSSITGNNITAAAYFGDFDVGAKLALETLEERLKNLPGLSTMPPCVFWAGVCCYAVASESNNATSDNSRMNRGKVNKYRKMAFQCRKYLKEWVKKGNPNCQHTLAFLNAEHDLLHGRYDAAVAKYRQAIEMAGSRNFINDQALANERLAACLLNNMNQKAEAGRFFLESMRLNGEWGAFKKVELQDIEYRSIWE